MSRQVYHRLALFVTLLCSFAAFALAGEKPAGAPAPTGVIAPAVRPKPLSAAVQKGLAYLVNQQQADGGWGQGGGWRAGNRGGRVEGANVPDPPDVASTCTATLALLRSGSTPRHGPYAQNVAKAVDFICKHIDRADNDSLYVTDVRDTQIQVKIGPYVDTFLAALVLAELKGKMPDDGSERRLVACLDKTVAKVERNQKEDGTFAGNTGWASVFSQGLAGKALNRARQNGVKVRDETLARAERQATESLATGRAARGADMSAARLASGRLGSLSTAGPIGRSGTPAAGAPSDAGVPIYSRSNDLLVLSQSVTTSKDQKRQAERVLRDKNAPEPAKEKARADLGRISKLEVAQKSAVDGVVKQLGDRQFIQGFGSNGGEEFLSYLNISESLVARGGEEWAKWDRQMTENLSRIQNGDGSWSGDHCITGRTICSSAALLVLLADRTPVPAAANRPRQ